MSVVAQFQDRTEAGQFLAGKLAHHAGDPLAVVLALPPGGAPVAYEVARALDAPLDIFLVHKLGVPGYDELAMGIVGSRGVRVLNNDVIQRLGLSESMIAAIVQERRDELEQRERFYRDGREPLVLEDRKVILVDDGMATGSGMRAAVLAAREMRPKSIIVAVPVASPDTCGQLHELVDELICGICPEPFYSIGAWYADYIQVPDEEVRAILNHAAHERRVRRLREGHKDLSIQEDIMS